MKSFWLDLPRPFAALAPLDGVTDVVFRQVITELGKPDVLFTEFTPVDGLMSGGRARVLPNLFFTPEQQPVVAQIWGTKPEQFLAVAKDIKERGFSGIDINMGCPERVIIKNGACSALIKTPELAKEIIQATQEGAGGLPVSVKTRIGYSHETIDEWIGFLLKLNLSALTVHLRTVSEMSRVPAHWEFMPRVKALRDEIAPTTVLLGNGDITSLSEVTDKYDEYGCDGFMIGRGIFANPWFFDKSVDMQSKTIAERIELYQHHVALFEKQWQGTNKNFALLKKFGKTYISNFPDAATMRDELMQTRKLEELKEKLQAFRKSY